MRDLRPHTWGTHNKQRSRVLLHEIFSVRHFTVLHSGEFSCTNFWTIQDKQCRYWFCKGQCIIFFNTKWFCIICYGWHGIYSYRTVPHLINITDTLQQHCNNRDAACKTQCYQAHYHLIAKLLSILWVIFKINFCCLCSTLNLTF